MAYRCPINKKILKETEKDTISIKESLEILLPRFSNIQDWADVEKWLKRVKKLFEVKKSPFITQKNILFRRLAQSLHPSLPLGVHSTVLDIYNLFLENLKISPENIINDLHHVTLGLFPYAQICSNQIKPKILEILEDHFLKLGFLIGPLLAPIFAALLPSLIDNNENMKKKVFKFFDKLQDIFPMAFISNAIWQTIKRSPKSRYGGLMYLTTCISKKDNIADVSSSFISDQMSEVNDLNLVKNIDKTDFKKKNVENIEVEVVENNQVFDNLLNKFIDDISDDRSNNENDVFKNNIDNENMKFANNFEDVNVKENDYFEEKNLENKANNENEENEENEENNDNNDNNDNSENYNNFGNQDDFENQDNFEKDNYNENFEKSSLKNETENENNIKEENKKFFQEDDNKEFFSCKNEKKNSLNIERDLIEDPNNLLNGKDTPVKPKKFMDEDNVIMSSIKKIDFSENSSNPDLINNLNSIPEKSEKSNNEQNKEIEKKVEEELDIENENQISIYDKFINYSKKKYQEMVEKSKNFDEFFPKRDLVIEALVECFYDEKSLIRKKSLDFVINFVNLENNLRSFTDLEIIILTKHALLILSDSDLSVRRRVFRYILGPEDEIDEEDDEDFDIEKMPDEKILNIFFAALKEILNDQDKNNLIKVFKVLQNVVMEKEIIIDPLIKNLNLFLMNALVFITESENIIDEKKNYVRSSIRRFFESIISHYEIFLEIYILNDKNNIKNKALELLLEFTKTHNDDKNKNNIRLNLLLEGYVKVGIRYLEDENLENESVKCFQSISDLINHTNDEFFTNLSYNLKVLLLTFLKTFQNLINNFKILEKKGSKTQNNQKLKSFEKGLLFSTWILLKLEKKDLIENWVKDIEIFLNKVSSNPNFILATIKGIYRFFSSDTNKFQIVKDTLESILNLAIKKAWELLDNIEYHSHAIKLILQLNEQNCESVVKLLNKKLDKEDNIDIRIHFVRRLVTFWNLTENLELRHNDVLLERYCIFRLLDFLEDDHPILRQISKSWLIDSSEKYYRIVDPMIISLLKNSHFYQTLNGKLMYFKKYDVETVFKIYKRMKNLLTNDQGSFSDFFNKSSISDNLLIEMYNCMTQNEIKKINYYFEIILNLILKFMQSSVICFLGMKFKKENLLIKTASCESLEIIINCLCEKNPKIINEKLIDIIQKTYYINVKNGCSMMQIHLLNLLKVVIFKSNSDKKNIKKKDIFFIKKIFEENNLLDNVLESIKYSNNNYTLLKIIDFLSTIIQLYCNEFKEEDIKQVISLIFEYYFNYLKSLKKQKKLNNNHSKMIIIQSSLNMISKFCNLENFLLPKERGVEGMSLVGFFTFGAFGRNRYIPKSVNFKSVEDFFLENMDKIILIIIDGWKLLHFEFDTMQSFNLGFDGFKENTQEDAFNKYIKKSGDHLKNEDICDFAEKLFFKYQKNFIENLMKTWYNIYKTEEGKLQFQKLKKEKNSEKILDFLIYLNIDFFEFDQKLINSDFLKNILKDRKKKSKTIVYDLAQKEASFLCLYYSFLKFLKYDFIEDKKTRKDFLRKLWNTVIKTMQYFTKSDHVFVLMWIINIYYLCARKYPLQEIIGEYSLKRSLHDHENNVFEKIIDFTCDKNALKIDPYNEGLNKFSFLYPIPAKLLETILLDWNLFESKIFLDFNDEIYLKYFTKIMTLIFLQKVTLKVLTSTYDSDKNHHIAKRIYTLVSKLFEELTKEQEHTEMTKKIHEEIIEYIFVFLETSRNFLLKNIQNLIQDYFDSDKFFYCSPKSLNFLSNIIKWHVPFSEKDILNTYLEK